MHKNSNNENNEAQENSRNQIANEVDENIKNPFWKYLIVAAGILVAFCLIGWTIYSKIAGEEVEDDPKKAGYDTKGRAFNPILDTLKRKENPVDPVPQDLNKTEPQPLIKEINATKKTDQPVVLTKSGVVVGEAANTPAILGGNNLKFKKKQVFLNLGQEEDESGNVTPKVSGEGNFNGEIFSPTAAYFSTFDRNLLLAKGTYIGCSLKTRLVSDIKGGIACIVSNDVYSNNGRTLLIEKGSIVTGTYSGASVEEGMERIYVIWQEIRTPNNIIIPVFSGASDRLGSAGIEGWVDNHYFKRFGSAILVSVIDDFISAFANRVSQNNSENSGNNTNVFTPESTTQQVNDLASKTLDKMINIKPTLYKNHGDIVGIYVNRDIDFRNVYELRRKER